MEAALIRKNRLEIELENAQKSSTAGALQVFSWATLIAGFVVFTGLSFLGDMTPWPFDGTIFGEIGGSFLTALVLKGYRAVTEKST